MARYKVEQDDWLIVYLKYLLFVFNFFFWVGGATVLAVGVWTLVEKSGYLSILASSTFAASAYILIFAGALVMVTGFLGFGAIIREDRSCLSTLSEELKQHLTRTLAENYRQPGAVDITLSVDRLQQDFKCCGSNSSADWQHSAYILSQEAEGRRVPDSCCKTVVVRCGQRVHPSNIYKVEGGCITKLEQFLADHLLLMGAVGIGVACLQGRPPASRSVVYQAMCRLRSSFRRFLFLPPRETQARRVLVLPFHGSEGWDPEKRPRVSSPELVPKPPDLWCLLSPIPPALQHRVPWREKRRAGAAAGSESPPVWAPSRSPHGLGTEVCASGLYPLEAGGRGKQATQG
ncbi:tetraspanin-11 isoform X9 [Canis lupus familiaris]|uniref:tetraspanin-11 isoform X9 n=2 Tax=Canis lupus familiaris TaxID=9615 RepID=UPI0018F351CE|nr:tetraspanin-11 isoform X9 [Canis lupus familiaris]